MSGLLIKAVNCKEMNDAKVLPQLHALVWGNKRGVKRIAKNTKKIKRDVYKIKKRC